MSGRRLKSKYEYIDYLSFCNDFHEENPNTELWIITNLNRPHPTNVETVLLCQEGLRHLYSNSCMGFLTFVQIKKDIKNCSRKEISQSIDKLKLDIEASEIRRLNREV